MSRRRLNPDQLPLIKPDSSWKPPTDYPSLRHFPIITIDCETHDPGLNLERGSSWATGEGQLLGFVVTTPIWSRYYALRHPEDNVENPDNALAWLRNELKWFQGEVVGQNIIYDLGWLGRESVEVVAGKLRDTMYAAALLDEDRPSYSLNALAAGYKLLPKDELLLREAGLCYGLREPKKAMHRLPARFVGPYAERDGTLTSDIDALQRDELRAQDLHQIHALEHSLIPLHLRMRRQGIRIDTDRVTSTRKVLIGKENEQLAKLRELVGFDVDVWSGRSVALACDQAKLEYPRTAFSEPSFTKEWLEDTDHPITLAVRRARTYNKARSTFLEGMVQEHVTPAGRVHPELHPLRSDEGGAVSGRYSCTDPNMGFVPAKDEEIAGLIRSLFLPEEGQEWCVFDIAQQEPRIQLHYASLLDMPGAAEAVRRIQENPRIDYHGMVADMTGLPRGQAKQLNLGTAYEMGGAKLCRKLHLPTEWWAKKEWDPERQEYVTRHIEVAGEEGKRVIKQYHANFPFVKGTSNHANQAAQERGYIKTLLGRRCRFQRWEKNDWSTKDTVGSYEEAVARWGEGNVRRAKTYRALNRAVQGSAADQIKKAMQLLFYEHGLMPMVQVYDELDLSLPPDPAARTLVDEVIRGALPLAVPVLTDIEVGPSWGEVKKLEG